MGGEPHPRRRAGRRDSLRRAHGRRGKPCQGSAVALRERATADRARRDPPAGYSPDQDRQAGGRGSPRGRRRCRVRGGDAKRHENLSLPNQGIRYPLCYGETKLIFEPQIRTLWVDLKKYMVPLWSDNQVDCSKSNSQMFHYEQ